MNTMTQTNHSFDYFVWADDIGGYKEVYVFSLVYVWAKHVDMKNKREFFSKVKVKENEECDGKS